MRAVYEAGGVGGEVPTDMPRPLRVGQPVVARHPGTRTAADGIVLTIKPSKYRVQFNRCGEGGERVGWVGGVGVE